MTAPTLPHVALTARQCAIVIAAGVAFWFGFAIAVRLIGADTLLDGGVRTLATFALLVPVSMPVVALIRRAAGLGAAQLLPGMALSTMAALFCDGLIFTWYPQLYGVTGAVALPVSAGVLWGAGAGLLVAWLMGRREGA
jgi:hypothetical protein